MLDTCPIRLALKEGLGTRRMTLPESKANSQLSRPQGMFPPTSLITSRPYTNDNHYLSLSKAWINKIVRILKTLGLIKALFAEWSRRCVRYLTAMAASRHQSAVTIRVFCLRAHSPTAAVDHLGEILTVFLNSNQHIDVLSNHPEYIDPSWFICIDGIRGHNTSLTSGFNSCASIVYSAKGKQEVANKVYVMDGLFCRLNLMGMRRSGHVDRIVIGGSWGISRYNNDNYRSCHQHHHRSRWRYHVNQPHPTGF